MVDPAAYQISYRTEQNPEVVIRTIDGPEKHSETYLTAADLHATLTEARRAIEEHERAVGRVRYVILGVIEYDKLVAYGILQHRDEIDEEIHLTSSTDHGSDPHAWVVELLSNDVIAISGSEIRPVSSPVELLARELSER